MFHGGASFETTSEALSELNGKYYMFSYHAQIQRVMPNGTYIHAFSIGLIKERLVLRNNCLMIFKKE